MLENTDSINSKSSKFSKSCKGIWSKEEHTLMLEFLNQHKDRIEEHVLSFITSKHRCNKPNFFQAMAMHVKTKTVSQCKSRYQKKELEMLTLLGLPYSTIRSYFMHKKLKNPFVKVIKSGSQKMKVKSRYIGFEKLQSIREVIESADDLRRVISKDIMPRVLNTVVKDEIQMFIENLINDKNPEMFMSLANVNSIQKILSKHGIFQLRAVSATVNND